MYREGSSKIVRGVDCDVVRVELGKSHEYLAQEWKMSLNELYKPMKKKRGIRKDG